MQDVNTMSMLDAVRDLVEAERGLTEALENAHPLLHNLFDQSFSSSTSSSLTSSSTTTTFPSHSLLPTPKDLNAAKEVLALARSLSSRSSLPPFPSQLRGGALGSMQRKLTKLERLKKDKQRLEEEEQKQQQQKEQQLLLQQQQQQEEKEEKQEKGKQNDGKDPKLGENQRKVGILDGAGGVGRRGSQQARVEKTFMNLSDSSSEEEDSDGYDDDSGSDDSE